MAACLDVCAQTAVGKQVIALPRAQHRARVVIRKPPGAGYRPNREERSELMIEHQRQAVVRQSLFDSGNRIEHVALGAVPKRRALSDAAQTDSRRSCVPPESGRCPG